MSTDHLGNSWEHGLALVLKTSSGEPREVKFAMADLASPERMRARWYAATGIEMPHYDHDDHTKILEVMFSLAGYRQVGPDRWQS